MKTKAKIKCSVHVDTYNNVSRTFRIDYEGNYPEHIIISSGSNSMSIAVKGNNNGFVFLDHEVIHAMIKELQEIEEFSKDARRDFAAFWDAKNAIHNFTGGIQGKYKDLMKKQGE